MSQRDKLICVPSSGREQSKLQKQQKTKQNKTKQSKTKQNKTKKNKKKTASTTPNATRAKEKKSFLLAQLQYTSHDSFLDVMGDLQDDEGIMGRFLFY